MSEEPTEPTRRKKKPSLRRSYADEYQSLESRVRLALPVLLNATAEDALLRIKIATDVLQAGA